MLVPSLPPTPLTIDALLRVIAERDAEVALLKHMVDKLKLQLARRVLDLNAEDGDMRARVGLDTGPAVQRRGDWFGTTVNTAARVTATANAGELLMTERTQLAAEGLLGGQLRERGRRRLKGLPEHTLFGEALA